MRSLYKSALATQSSQEVRSIEAGLIARVAVGDQAAFRELVEAHQDRVFQVARRVVKNDDDAADVAQEVWIALSRNAQSFRGDSSLGSWLHRVAVNASLMFLRRHKRHTGHLELKESHLAQKHMIDHIETRSFLQHVEKAWPVLNPLYRAVLVLKVKEEKSTAEIAEAMKISVPAAKSRIHRARLELAMLCEL